MCESRVYAQCNFKTNDGFIYPVWVFYARTIDRLGKGIRTSARDAILSEESTFENKGKDTVTALGFYSGLNSIFSLIAGSLAGFL